jgi:hypothetical protein
MLVPCMIDTKLLTPEIHNTSNQISRFQHLREEMWENVENCLFARRPNEIESAW